MGAPLCGERLTVGEWVRDAASRLESAGIESARLEAQVLLGHAFGRERAWVLAHGPDTLSDSVLAMSEGLLARRVAREPLAYILGYREFYGRRFVVSPDVLIPRQETELLVEAGLEVFEGGRVLDLCCGSGCVGITFELEYAGPLLPANSAGIERRPGVSPADAKASRPRHPASVTASDLSPAALRISETNAKSLQAHIRFINANLFDHRDLTNFDLILSNPPYVSVDDELAPEIRNHEPPLALFADENGLAIYRRILEQVQQDDSPLKPGGWILLELGAGQAESVSGLVRGWMERRWIDLNGITRVIGFRRPYDAG